MDDKLVDSYLKKIDALQLREKILEFVEIFELLAGETIEEIFVTDVIDESDQRRTFESIWAFSATYWLEAREFLTNYDVDVSPYKKSINYLGIEYRNAKPPSEYLGDAWMQVEVATDKVGYSTLLASSQENCRRLFELVSGRLRTNLRGEPGAD